MSALRAGALGGGGFECTISRAGDTVRVALRGYLDEDGEFPDFEVRDGDRIEVDFAGLLGMDTSGVMIWEQFCFLYPRQSFVFLNCREFVVKNANFFPRFLPEDVVVESFDVKFRCEDCNATAMVPFVRDRHFAVWSGGFGRLHTVEHSQVCDCGSRRSPKMVESESKYLEFLKRTR